MTLTINDRSLFTVLLILLVVCVYAPKKRKLTQPPLQDEPTQSIDLTKYNPPITRDENPFYIDMEKHS